MKFLTLANGIPFIRYVRRMSVIIAETLLQSSPLRLGPARMLKLLEFKVVHLVLSVVAPTQRDPHHLLVGCINPRFVSKHIVQHFEIACESVRGVGSIPLDLIYELFAVLVADVNRGLEESLQKLIAFVVEAVEGEVIFP